MTMKNTSKLIQSIIILATIAVILFALIQLTQHGYDPPSLNDHLIVEHKDLIHHTYNGRNIESLSEIEDIQTLFKTVQQQLEQQNNALTDINNRLTKLEQNTVSTNTNTLQITDSHKDNIKTTDNNNENAPTNIIYNNPLNNLQCQNAIIDLENININELIDEHVQHIACTKHQSWQPHIWTREGIGSLIAHRCYRPHTPVRTIDKYMTIIRNNKSFSAKNNNLDIPIYYHMPKCASSSTAGMLQEHFNFHQHWVDGPEINHNNIYTNCGFTFVRNPIHRFISGYYTINNMLWRDCLDINGKKTFSNHTIKKWDKFQFIRMIGEPQRFQMYIEEMFKDPYYFGKTLPFRHTGSQMYFLSNWYGSDIQFFGRVEKFEEHWNKLMEFENCKWFKNNMKRGVDKIEVPNSMYHYGFYGPTLWRKSNGEKKEYVDALGIRANLEKMYDGNTANRVDPNDILAPAYYFINEKTFNKIVKYFWQDFVCFGYPTDYNSFKKYVEKFVNPNDM
eukprot:144809_1